MRWLLLALGVAGCTHVVWLGHSDDRVHRVEVIERAGRQAVRVDDVEGPMTGGVAVESLAIDPSGKPSYVSLGDDGWALTVGGTRGPGWDDLGLIARSDDGGVAYTSRRDGGWAVVVDGVALSAKAPTRLERLAGRWVWVDRSADLEELFLDGRGTGPVSSISWVTATTHALRWLVHEGADTFVLSPEGRRGPFRKVLHLDPGPPEVLVTEAMDGGWQVLRDGVEVATHARPPKVVGGPDGALATIIDIDAGQLVVAEVPLGPFDEVSMAVWPREARHPVFAARSGGDWQVIAPGWRSGPWLGVERLHAAGRHVAFIGQSATTDTVVLDGVALATGPRLTSLVLSREGTHLAYLAARGSEVRFVVHRESASVEHPVDLALEDTVAFAPNGRAGCVAGERRSRTLFVLLDDGARVPLSLEEVVAAQARWPNEHARRSRQWVAAEAQKQGGIDAGRE